MPYRIGELSKRLVAVDVMNLLDGSPEPLTGFVGEVAFTAPGFEPATADWLAADWVADNIDGSSSFGLQVLVGPTGGTPTVDVTLVPGTYTIWVRVTTPDEVFCDVVDTITVTGTNNRVTVVSAAELSDYMGYPFTGEQITAVLDVIDALQAEAEAWLQADLTVQQWTEVYTIPWEGPAPFVNSYIGVDYQSLYPNSESFNMGWATNQVLLAHWPQTEWIGLAVNTAVQLAQPGITANGTYIPGVATVTDTTTGTGPLVIAQINGSVHPVLNGTNIFNLLVTAGAQPVNVGDTITISNGTQTLTATVAVGGIAPHTTSLISVGQGVRPAPPTWLPITPPIYPEPLPTFVPGTQVQVIYKAGWDGPSKPDVKNVVKRAAARELTNRLDDAVGVRQFSVVRLPDGPTPMSAGLTQEELNRLSRYRKRVIV